MESQRWPLVGRDAECAAIVDVLAAEGAGSIVIAGPAGVGRTRLLHEALSFAREEGRTTRWAAATSTARGVPLGALAPLLPAIDAAPESLALLKRATEALAESDSGGPPVLGIDDAHLLDPLSVTLLHQLAARGEVTLVLAVRTTLAATDPAVHLWKDQLAIRLEVQPLTRHSTEHLIGLALDGDVETRTGSRLWRMSQGIPLFLRELVEDGLRSGRLRRWRGLWRWEGAMVPSQRLGDIVLTQLGDLDVSEWRAMEVIASAQPVRADEVAELSSPQAVASLQRRGVMTDAVTGRYGEVQADHPLVEEVVRSRATEAELQTIRRQLASRAAASGSPQDLVDRCALFLDAGLPTPDAGVLTTAAQRAVAMLDHPLAERLARAGIEAGGGIRAHLTLIEAARWQGHATRSERLAREAIPAAASDDDRARLAATRVLTLFCSLGRADDATAVLEEAGRTIRSEEGRAVLSATEAVLAFLGGNPREAERLGRSVLASAAGGTAEPLAAAAAAAALAVTGRTGEALALARAGWTALDSLSVGVELAFVRIALAQAEVMALFLGGHLFELERRTAELYRCNLTAPEWAGDAIACLHRGWAALGRGRPRVAARWLREALAGLEQRDPAGQLGLCRSLMAIATAMLGDATGAHRLLADAGGEAGTAQVYGPYAALAEAWLAAAHGRRPEAGALALDAARLAARQGQSAVEAVLLDGALRFGGGSEVADRLGALAPDMDSAFVAVAAERARATVTGAGDGLESASRRFEELGATLCAAEAAAEAASAHERSGRRQAAAMSRVRSAALARDCGLSETPALDVTAPPALTSREGEVVGLAVLGMSNQAIADKLVVSVRTVEAHLAHAYAKLGVNGRNGLAALDWGPAQGASVLWDGGSPRVPSPRRRTELRSG